MYENLRAMKINKGLTVISMYGYRSPQTNNFTTIFTRKLVPFCKNFRKGIHK